MQTTERGADPEWTPHSAAHADRFQATNEKVKLSETVKIEEKSSDDSKNREIGS